MNPRLYRLIELRHRIERLLQAERLRLRPDPLALISLAAKRLKARRLSARLVRRSASA